MKRSNDAEQIFYAYTVEVQGILLFIAPIGQDVR
jgi:hypothetical protein